MSFRNIQAGVWRSPTSYMSLRGFHRKPWQSPPPMNVETRLLLYFL